jgi:hypothetical protein
MAASHGANGTINGLAAEKVNIDIVTLTRFLTEEQAKHQEATGDFTYTLPPRSPAPANRGPACSATPSSSPSNPSPTTSAAPRSST